MKTQVYCAIIGDIKKSRVLPERAKIQLKFQRAIDIINREYKEEIASKFILTLGDEFQGLLNQATESYRLIRRFQDIMDGVPFAFGIGIGSLSTSLKKEALGMDGACFHHARAALQQAKKKKREVIFSFDGDASKLTNALVGLLEKEWEKLTPRQREIVQLLKKHKPNEITKKLKISRQAVWKTSKTALVSQMNEAEGSLHEFLSTIR
jgi:hypothetical protein